MRNLGYKYLRGICQMPASQSPDSLSTEIKNHIIDEEMRIFMEKILPSCPVETTLLLISDRWKVLIIRDLLDGTKRFGELKKSIGNVSQKVLTANLRSMEDNGLLTRKVYAEVPPRVEYTLTETGYSLKPILDALSEWGTEYKRKIKAVP